MSRMVIDRNLVASATIAAMALVACKFPPPPDVLPGDADVAIDAPTPSRFAVGGHVEGLWIGGSITLHLSAGDVSEDIAAGADSAFTFAADLLDATSYLVTVADDGPDHDCAVQNGSGTIDGADVEGLQVTCTNLIPHSIALSIPTTFTFDPRVRTYSLPVSLLQQAIAVSVSGPTLTGASVNGVDVTVGTMSPWVAIGTGQPAVPVVVRKGALSRRYDLSFDRGATPIAEALYARASNAGAGDWFGTAVAASGDYVAIGAHQEDSSSTAGTDDNVSNAGAVYLYRRSGTTWSQAQILKGSAITAQRSFGSALDMDGDTLVVGATNDDAGGQDTGAAYVFRLDRTTGRWNEEQRLTASDPHPADRFGGGVAVSGDRVVIGASGHDVGAASGTDLGLVYVFVKSGATWLEETRIRQPSPQVRDQFGTTLALDGDTLVATFASSLIVLRRSGLSWTQESTPAEAVGRVDLQGDTLVVGQPYDDSGNGQPGDTSAPDSGAVRVFVRTGSAWSQTAYLKASLPRPSANVGAGVALYGNTIATVSRAPGALLTFQRVGASWVAGEMAPVSIGPVGPDNLGEPVAISRNGAVIANATDTGTGANAALSSGTAWFFR